MKENGFTLIELLATIAIMGLLTAMITPSIINLQNSNKKKKFEIYGKTMVEAAKIYVQKEGDDLTSLGVSNWVGCIYITYSQLLATELIKPFDDTDYEKLSKVDDTIDVIRKRFGNDAVKRAVFVNQPIDHMSGGISREKRSVDYSKIVVD